ncbi:MAG: L,D-transpeptidase family protein [Hyphomicrobiales bacterium]
MTALARRLMAVLLLALVAMPLAAPHAFAANNEKVAGQLEEVIKKGEDKPTASDADQERTVAVYMFYFDRKFKPVWVRDNGAKSKARDLLSILKDAADDGLDPSWYHVQEIDDLIDETDPRGLAELELLLTRAFTDYARDLSKGRVEPGDAENENATKPIEIGPVTLIDGAEQAEDLQAYVDTLKPKSDRYDRMKTALAQYRRIAADGGWPDIPEGPAIKPGMSDPRLPVIRKYLTITGDLKQDTATGDAYDPAAVDAVKAFQARHGLMQDGVVGGTTLTEMKVPIDRRIRQLEVNMERRRWMNRDPGDMYVFVNLADQYLKVMKGEKTIHTALLVVGKPYTRTPTFSEDMTYVVINPYWNVPTSIANKEYLPKLKQNPGYLKAQNIRIFAGAGDDAREVDPYSVNWSSMSRIPYSLRQDSGKSNALGHIKFMFPNKWNVYIHDTPAKALFSKDLRVYSHGCMRVQNPLDLAVVLLGNQGWTKDKIQAQIDSGQQKIITLKNKIPVHVTYLTAWVDKDGTVNFRRDVYKRDDPLIAAMYREADYEEH